MSIPDDCPIPNDYAAQYPKVLEAFEEILEESWMPRLECLLAQIGCAIERQEVEFDFEEDEERFAAELLSKIINEGYGLVGALKNGALTAAHHNARSCLEMYASVSHVFSNEQKKEKKIRKFYEFEDLSRYARYNDICERDEKNIPDGMFQDTDIDSLEEKVPEWFNLFSVDGHTRVDIPEDADDEEKLEVMKDATLKHVNSWHYPASISGLLNELQNSTDEDGERRDPDGTIASLYDSLSYVTHLSSHTKILAGGSNLIGLPVDENGPDIRLINRLIGSAILGIAQTIEVIEEKLEKDFDLSVPPIDLDRS